MYSALVIRVTKQYVAPRFPRRIHLRAQRLPPIVRLQSSRRRPTSPISSSRSGQLSPLLASLILALQHPAVLHKSRSRRLRGSRAHRIEQARFPAPKSPSARGAWPLDHRATGNRLGPAPVVPTPPPRSSTHKPAPPAAASGSASKAPKLPAGSKSSPPHRTSPHPLPPRKSPAATRAGPLDPRATRNQLAPQTPNKDRTIEYQNSEGEEFEARIPTTMEEAIEAITDTYHKDKWPDQVFAQKVRNFYYKRFQDAHKKEADKSANFANAVMLVENCAPLILIELGPILAGASEGVRASLVALGQSGGGLRMAAYLAASSPALVTLVEAIATYIFAPEGYIPSPEGMLATGEELEAKQVAQQVEGESEQVAAKVANSIPPRDLPPGGAARARVPLDGATENPMTGAGVGLRARRQEKAPLSERRQGPHYRTAGGPQEEFKPRRQQERMAARSCRHRSNRG